MLHPRSRVQSCAKKRTRAYRFSGSIPAFPAQWLYGLCRAPRRRIRLVTVIGELMALPRPVGLTKTSADLTPATGARTTRFCRTQPPAPKASTGLVPVRRSFSEGGFSAVRLAHCRPLTGLKPALRSHRAPDAAASTASRPNVRDDGQRPSTGTGRRELCR